MPPLSLFHSRTFAGANLLTLGLYGFFVLPLDLIQVHGDGRGAATVPLVSILLLSRWSGRPARSFWSQAAARGGRIRPAGSAWAGVDGSYWA